MITNDDEEEDIKNSEKMTINFLSVVETFHSLLVYFWLAQVWNQICSYLNLQQKGKTQSEFSI